MAYRELWQVESVIRGVRRSRGPIAWAAGTIDELPAEGRERDVRPACERRCQLAQWPAAIAGRRLEQLDRVDSETDRAIMERRPADQDIPEVDGDLGLDGDHRRGQVGKQALRGSTPQRCRRLVAVRSGAAPHVVSVRHAPPDQQRDRAATR